MSEPIDAVRAILRYIGEDPDREGLVDTPMRVLKAWAEWGKGYDEKPDEILKTFEDGATGYDEFVFQGNIPVWSTCEHHMAPFFGVAHIGYIPSPNRGRIVGLSKLSRLLDVYARRLQVQERLTVQVADALFKGLQPEGVGVVIQCRHTCIESRGVNKAGSVTITSALRGSLKTEPETRGEFLKLVEMAGR